MNCSARTIEQDSTTSLPSLLKPQPQNSYKQSNCTELVEALEQALKIQINKRIEAEIISQHNSEKLKNLIEVKDLLKEFLSELDGLDDDGEKLKVCRKDIVWMMKEIYFRLNDIVSTNGSIQHTDRVVSKCSVRRESSKALLEGRILQLKETIQELMVRLTNSTARIDEMESTRNQDATRVVRASTSNTKKKSALQERYDRLEIRHGNVVKGMQESLNVKTQEINRLKQTKSVQGHRSTIENKPVGTAEDESQNNSASIPQDLPHNSQMKIQPLIKSPHKDLQIKALTEDIEDRDIIIEELKSELDLYMSNVNILQHNDVETRKDGKTERSTEVNKVKIRYLENIIYDLEHKLRSLYPENKNIMTYANGRPTLSNGASFVKENRCEFNSPRHRYGSFGYHGISMWDGCHGSSLFGDDPTIMQISESSSRENMELKILELKERLQGSQSEVFALKEELKTFKHSLQADVVKISSL